MERKTFVKALAAKAFVESSTYALGGIHKYFLLQRLDLQKRYNGGWALITGASDGIGKAYACELAKEGFNLCVIARNPVSLEKAKEEMLASAAQAGKTIQVRTIIYDYSKLESMAQVTEYMKMLEEATADLDIAILINNVGFGWIEDFLNNSPESAQEFINVLCKSYVYTTKQLLPRLLARQPKAAIINVTSNPQNTPTGMITMYASCKLFTYGFSRSLRDAYGKQIDVMTVVPSSTRSGFVTTNYIGQITATRHAKSVFDALGQREETRGHWLHAIMPHIKKTPLGIPIGLWNLREVKLYLKKQKDFEAKHGKPRL